MIPYAHFFNEKFNVNLEVKEDCFIDIYKAKTMEEITEFCTHRTSFCVIVQSTTDLFWNGSNRATILASGLYKFKIEVFCGYYETMTSLR